MSQRYFIASMVLAGLACGNRGGGDVATSATDGATDSSDGNDPSQEAFGLRLTVRSSYETGHIDQLYIAPDDRFIVTSLRIENESRTPPVSVASLLFAMRSGDGVEFLGSTATELLPDGCGAAQVAEGGMFECSVAFAVPLGQSAAAVVYRPAPEIEIVVQFESTPCDVCGNDCVDLDSDPSHCGACNAGIGAGQVCRDGQPACEDELLTICANECVDLRTDRQNCGMCGVTVPNCVDGAAGPEECGAGETLCSGFCYPNSVCSVCCAGACFTELTCICENDLCLTPGEWTPCFIAHAATPNCEEACMFGGFGVCLNGLCPGTEAAGLLYQSEDACFVVGGWETALETCDEPIPAGEVTRCCCGNG